jgi:heme exporter protein B
VGAGPGQVFAAVLRRDLQVAWRRWSDAVNPALFFLLVVTLFPLALSPKAEFLRAIGPGVLWVGVLLATLLALNLLFRADVDDGTMEQLLLSDCPLPIVRLAKTLAHWVTTIIPVVIVAPLLAITYHLPPDALPTLVFGLLIGTPALSLVGSIGAALTVGLRQGGALLAVLVVPLMLPVPMFGARATDLAVAGEDPTGLLYLLGALSVLATGLAPLASAAAIRLGID